MTDNIYSNPSGYTDIPWQLSVNWFKDKILTEVALIEYKMANRRGNLRQHENLLVSAQWKWEK